jgi:hypothetical protein
MTAPTITKHYLQTFRRHNDPTSGTRAECWLATTDDGLWRVQRLETRGTPWEVQYVPFALEVAEVGNLDSALELLDDPDRLNVMLVKAIEKAALLEASLVLIRRACSRPDFYDLTPRWLQDAASAVLQAVA